MEEKEKKTKSAVPKKETAAKAEKPVKEKVIMIDATDASVKKAAAKEKAPVKEKTSVAEKPAAKAKP